MRKETRSIKIDAQPTLPQEWVELVDITPAIAEKWLGQYAYQGQRKVSKAHVEYLAQEMKAGRFRTSEFRLMHTGTTENLTNGQHRLHGVVQSGVTIRGVVYHFATANAEEVATDYGSADRNKGRTITEALAATEIVSLSGLAPSRFNRVAAAVKPIIGGFTSTSFSSATPLLKSVGVRVKAVQHWLPASHQFFEVTHGADTDMGSCLLRAAVLSVGMVTMKAAPEIAEDFWSAVALNDGLKKGDPCRVLAMFLLKSASQSMPSAAYARRVAVVWNAFYEGRPLHVIQVADKDALKPIRIAGTEYTGKSVLLSDFGNG